MVAWTKRATSSSVGPSTVFAGDTASERPTFCSMDSLRVVAVDTSSNVKATLSTRVLIASSGIGSLTNGAKGGEGDGEGDADVPLLLLDLLVLLIFESPLLPLLVLCGDPPVPLLPLPLLDESPLLPLLVLWGDPPVPLLPLVPPLDEAPLLPLLVLWGDPPVPLLPLPPLDGPPLDDPDEEEENPFLLGACISKTDLALVRMPLPRGC